MVSSAAKQAKQKKLAHERQERELFPPTRQMDPGDLSDPDTEQDEREVRFAPRGQSVEQMSATPAGAQATTDCEILNMVKTLNGAIAAVSQDTAKIQRAYEQLRAENIARDNALTDLSEIVKEYGLSPVRIRPQPVLQADVIDEEGNLRAADIRITWENNKTFLHGVRVVGPGPPQQTGMRPVMSTPHQPIGGRDRDSMPSTVRPPARPVMSTPHQPIGGRDRDSMPSTVRPPARPVMSTPFQPIGGRDRDLTPSTDPRQFVRRRPR